MGRASANQAAKEKSQIFVVGFAEKEFNGIPSFIADGTDDVLRCLLYVFIDAEMQQFFLRLNREGFSQWI